jgi:hypothetical protein
MPFSSVASYSYNQAGQLTSVAGSGAGSVPSYISQTIDVVLDGTFYDMWYSQDISDMSFSFYDEEVSDQQLNGVLKVVQWMNGVRHDVEKLK